MAVTAAAALLGALTGAFLAGGLAVAAGASPRRMGRRRDALAGASQLRLASATGAAAVVLVATRWPVATLLAAMAGFAAPSLLGGKAARDADLARIEALAAWAEMLRDTMAAASGLEQAIRATAPLTPVALRPHTTALAARLEHGNLEDAVRLFAAEVDDSTGDLIAAALLLAAKGNPRRLGQVLGDLAVAAHAEVTMRLRVEVGRARTRSSVRIITVFTVGFTFGLLLFNGDYLAPYATPGGQGVLAVVGGLYAAAFWWLLREARTDRSERFLDPGAAS